jgi:hypothetical protein
VAGRGGGTLRLLALEPAAQRFAPDQEAGGEGEGSEGESHCLGSYPGQAATGTRGYFGYAGSVLERSHSEKTEPRVLRTMRWCRQVSQRPALLLIAASIAAAEAHGCGQARLTSLCIVMG